MVEHAAVNRVVVGSSPTPGANVETFGFQGFFKAGRQIEGECQQNVQQKRVFALTPQQFNLTVFDSPPAF